ncbi:hypothetical protein acsn021_28120 [Anaerocolumna cellulosilytica]|uniref:Basal-body rod modification protein FlgD n=1 Tax=Anaerocolumna cellulosilytica TaxID=433286 RepID=A0A6S6QVG5_9FIRM|nr:flagellar hook capping FlgD N-terminal domain-containing protein [Anaerocolumna cellulosilytica]MBB5197029.1 flagellar basal-body rod modification protein FlgD [Anaerocolumna cellulosilytica]BCJ95243.1 hypothetical protein acsn021_28120 [Anaerocolumna cellulosilytica]
MSDLLQQVTNGKVVSTNSTSTASKSGTGSLDKTAFLKLLVTQMKYQDPLNPSTDTQFVEQLATFSQLEQMQNLNQTSSNNQAFGLVGMNVVVNSKDGTGNMILKDGTVDSVVISNGVANLVVNDNIYTLDQIVQVVDATYLLQRGAPYIPNPVKATFNKEEPSNISFEVNLGSDKTIADDIAFIIGGKAVDAKYVTLDGNKVTISKEAFMNLDNGTYKPVLMFNDILYTTVTNKITVTIEGTAPEAEQGEDSTENTDD